MKAAEIMKRVIINIFIAENNFPAVSPYSR